MNLKCKYIYFGFFIFCISIGTIVTNAVGQNDESSEIIEVEPDQNITLPCHPKLQNSIQNASDFDWVTDNDIPIFSNGRLSTFLYYDTIEPQVKVVNSSLFIRNAPYGNVTYICRLNRLHINYTYFIQETKIPETVQYTSFDKPISFREKGETVILPCITEKDIGSSIAGISYTWQRLNNNKPESIEIISLNQRILLRNNSANFQVAEDGSLIVPNFIPEYRIYYECHLSNGQYVTYYNSVNNEDEESRKKVSVIKRSIAVAPKNTVTLNCPAAKSPRDFVWVHNDKKPLSIGKNVVQSIERDHFKIDSDGRSLIIANFSSSFSGIYTCVTSNGEKYVYNVTEQKSIFRTIFAESRETISLPCSLSSDEDESNFVWIRNENEVLFINELVAAGGESVKLKIGDDKRSLVITEFSNHLAGVYVCHSTTGIDYTYNLTINASNFKIQTVFVDYGTKDLILPCPVINKTENASSEWIVENYPVNLSPSLLFLNKENFVTSFREYYEIQDDRSLIIKVLTQITYGVYTCRWSTGEQYVYNVTFRVHWRNHTVWANPGEILTLPCPMEDPRDRELNVINWIFMSRKEEILGDFNFIDGKMFPTSLSRFTFPDNIKFAGDKQSLLVPVSNITYESNSISNYICVLIRSHTVYSYSVNAKGVE